MGQLCGKGRQKANPTESDEKRDPMKRGLWQSYSDGGL